MCKQSCTTIDCFNCRLYHFKGDYYVICLQQIYLNEKFIYLGFFYTGLNMPSIVSTYMSMFHMLKVPKNIFVQVPITLLSQIFLDSPSSSQTRQAKRTVCCVLGIPTTLQPQYLILSTSTVLTTVDTSSTTTTELILRILTGIPSMPTVYCVKWKFMVGWQIIRIQKI